MLFRWCAAEARGDLAVVAALLDADFRGDGPDGRVLGKAQWLVHRRRAEWRPMDVRVNDHTAVAMGTSGARPFTLVAVRRTERWAIVNVQVGDRQIAHLADVPVARLDEPEGMTKLVADISMSLDGFVAGPGDDINDLVAWMFTGEVETPTATEGVAFRTSEASAPVIRGAFEDVGALLSGRRNFDLAQGWGGNHPMGVPTFVVTHAIPDGWPREGSSIHFVTDGLESAVARAREAAGGKIVGVATPNLTQQLLDAGLLDEIHLNLVPVVLGAGVPFFANIASAPVRLEGPDVVDAPGVTHLTYRVKR